jgi:dUTP pyrophosphatase
MKNIQVFKLNPKAIMPTRNKSSDVGLDLYALEDIFIEKGQTKVINTGLCIDIPLNHIGKIEDRSSMGSKGLRTGAGVIDPGFSGEIGVVLHNLTCTLNKDPILMRQGYQIKRGDKIAQIVIFPVAIMEPLEVLELWTSERGSKGFGSSGR